MEIEKKSRRISEDGEYIKEIVQCEHFTVYVDWLNGKLAFADVLECKDEPAAPGELRNIVAGKVGDKWDCNGFSDLYTVEELRNISNELLAFLEYIDAHLDLEKCELVVKDE